MRLTTSLFRWGKVVWLCCVQILRQRATDNLPKWFLAPTGLIKPWFHTEGNCCYTASYLPLGVSQRTCDPRNQALFLAPLPGSKRISARGVSRFQSLYFVIVLLSLFLFSLVCFIYQKHKKLVTFIFKLLSFGFVFILLKWVPLRTLSCVISLARTDRKSVV